MEAMIQNFPVQKRLARSMTLLGLHFDAGHPVEIVGPSAGLSGYKGRLVSHAEKVREIFALLHDQDLMDADWHYDIVPVGTVPDEDAELLEGCQCDNGHQQNDTVCRWCWGHGRRQWNDPDVNDPRPVLVHLA
jgi:hypothetical protein